MDSRPTILVVHPHLARYVERVIRRDRYIDRWSFLVAVVVLFVLMAGLRLVGALCQ